MANAAILQQLIDRLGISVHRFEKEIGVGQSRIDKAMKRDSKIGPDILDKIASRYDFINRNWLKTGTGDMFLPTPTGDKWVGRMGFFPGEGLTREQLLEEQRKLRELREDDTTYTKGQRSGAKHTGATGTVTDAEPLTDEDFHLLREYKALKASRAYQDIINMMVLEHESRLKLHDSILKQHLKSGK